MFAHHARYPSDTGRGSSPSWPQVHGDNNSPPLAHGEKAVGALVPQQAVYALAPVGLVVEPCSSRPPRAGDTATARGWRRRLV